MRTTVSMALAVLMLLFVAACGGAPDSTGEDAAVADRDVLREALAAAKADGLPLLIDVYADW